MSPELQNIIIAIASVIYVFSVVGILDYFVDKGFPAEISRKIVHICAGSWLIFWIFYDQSHWTKYLNILPSFIWTFLLLLKGFTAKENDKAVATMTRTGDRRELLRGPLYFTLVMNVMGTLYFYSPASLYAMGFLTWGDGLAPIIGKKFGKMKYKFYVEKTVEGSISILLFGMIGTILFFSIIFGYFNLLDILICGLAAMLIEAVSPPDFDNILIPAIILLLYSFILI